MDKAEQGFLQYEAEWIQVSEQQVQSQGPIYKSDSIFNPISVEDLDPKDPYLLNKMFEPYIFESDGRFYRLNVSRRQTSRQELEYLEAMFQQQLQQKQARKGGICPIREKLHNQLFDQIIRQATINLSERGILLMRIRDNLKMTFAAYQTLYQGSLVFGNRKAHVAETGVPELQDKIQKLRKKKISLQNKKIMLENELQEVQQGFREVNSIEQKARNDELVYMQNLTKRLEQNLNNIYDS